MPLAGTPAPSPPQLDVLMLVGFLSAVAAVACLVSRRASTRPDVLLCPSLASLAAYGFMTGAWLLGGVVASLSVATLRRRGMAREAEINDLPSRAAAHGDRLERLFGNMRIERPEDADARRRRRFKEN